MVSALNAGIGSSINIDLKCGIGTSLVFADYLRSHFSVSQPKALGTRARGNLSELCRAMCPEESHLFFYSPFSLAELLAAASNLSSSRPRQSCPYHAKAPPPLWHGFFFLTFSIFPGLYIFYPPCESHILLFQSTRWESLYILLLSSCLSLSPPAYQRFLNASY